MRNSAASTNSGGAGACAPRPAYRHSEVYPRSRAPTSGHGSMVPTAATRPNTRSRTPIATSTSITTRTSPRTLRNRAPAVSATVRLRSERARTRSGAWSVVATYAETRALPRNCNAWISASLTTRAACARRRATRTAPKWPRLCVQAPMSARATVGSPAEEVDDGLGELHDQRDRDDPEQSCRRRGREEGPDLVAPFHAGIDRSVVGVMADACVGRDDHPRAGESGAPAEVEGGSARVARRVEALERREQVGAHQEARLAHEEDVAHGVVLLLVELVLDDVGVRDPEAVDGPAHLPQQLGPLDVDHLRPDDGRVGAVRLLDQHPDRRRVEHDVVVAEEQERGTGHGGQRVVRDGGIPADLHRTDVGRRQHRRRPAP